MKKILVVILVAFVIIQFFPIDKNNPTPTPGMDFLKIKKTPPEVAKIINTSCYDCHSNETKYPWYANIAPASWYVKTHISDARKHLNFSTFAVYEPKVQADKLQGCVELVESKDMPLESYYLGHQDAKLSEEQRQILVKYFKKVKEDTERAGAF
ncbi:cytochrome C [Chryseobacterium nematophagum]|uniref:Cytochrome C n=1 Tax=Chryseobacterium nematophagum TaxID=2305228 RepID=A0A3M7LAZ1_9FLAO|nr:heme-binding domain-containing protein [Chryseobacterium nematophagum]RMZ59160.1 cytochrome C [Chryseobacterium nematophagum]